MSVSDKVESLHVAQFNQDSNSDREYYIPEKYQLGILTAHLRSHGFDFVTEGRVFCYPIDLLCARGETTIAIEMKAGDISRGIEQAWRNSDFVDFSYLSIWEEQVTPLILERVDNTPVGLLSVGEQVTQVSFPRSTPQQLCSKEGIINTVRPNVRNDASV